MSDIWKIKVHSLKGRRNTLSSSPVVNWLAIHSSQRPTKLTWGKQNGTKKRTRLMFDLSCQISSLINVLSAVNISSAALYPAEIGLEC